MRKVREVLRLHFDAGLSARKIALSCNIARSTVGEYINRAVDAGLEWPLPEDMDDSRLETVLFKEPNDHVNRSLPDMTYLHTEMRKKGVTLQLMRSATKQIGKMRTDVLIFLLTNRERNKFCVNGQYFQLGG
jgi:hypothetical protein